MKKNMNNKGFTLVEILAVVAILGILSGLAIMAYQRYVDVTKKKAYSVMLESTQSAMDEYLMDHPGATSVTFEELYEGDYLERPTDPSDKSEMCRGKVIIRPAEDQEEGALDINEYKVIMCCSNYLYTFKDNGEQASKDQYCKLDPYDYKQITSINVLNVYPNQSYANYFKNWMDAYGKGIIHVTPVFITDFNNNPSAYLGTSGNWKYDEIVFGFSDCNASRDLSAAAARLVDKYLAEGNAAVFGHDTLTANGCSSHVNFNTLAKYVNMELRSKVSYKSSNKVVIQKKGVFTEYPYEIGDIGTELTIPTSHVYGQVANGDVWITFSGASMASDLPANKIYLSTWGNNAFIQTGHSSGKATADEQKILANIIFYMVAKQYIEKDEGW